MAKKKKKGNHNFYGVAKSRDSCRELFGKLKIPPFHTQNILSLLLSVVNIKDHYKLNSEIYNINSR